MDNHNISHTYDPAAPYGQQEAATRSRMSKEELDGILWSAIHTYGPPSQTQMLFEEMAELQNAICKLSRGRGTKDDVCEEIADVMIMCLQMARIYGEQQVDQMMEYKLRRLKNRLIDANK